MSLTLTDAGKLTNDVVLAGIVETIVNESPVLRYLPFMEVNGTALTYNQELTLGNADFYAVGDSWVESAMTVQQKQVTLKILGGDVDVDSFLNQTYRNPNELKAAAIEKKAKAVAYAFNNTFYTGDSSTNAKQFDGLNKLCSAGQTYSLGTNGGAPSLDDFDKLLDYIKPGKPDLIVMSRRTRRGLKKLYRGSSSILDTDIDIFGRRIDFFDGIPVEIDDNISDAQTVGTANNCSTVYAIQFGFERGVMGLMNGMIQYDDLGELETKDATRSRIKWYCGLVNFRDIALARMTGVLPN